MYLIVHDVNCQKVYLFKIEIYGFMPTVACPCIYLFLIGKASELLKGDYNSDYMVCKYGYSINLPRRTNEHATFFKKEFNTEIELLCWSIIDKTHLSEAETQVKEYFEDSSIQYKKATELIVITKKQLSQVRII